MKRKKTIGSSIGLLIGIVTVILALVQGPWQLPLLIGAASAWGLWLLFALLHPSRRTAWKQKNQAGNFNRQLAQTLLHHVNYRVSACLKAGYPDARWEWMMRDPALFVAQSGTGRIRVYGVPDYEFADVTVDQNGKLSCALVKLATVQDAAEKTVPPNQQPADPQQWYETQGRETLEALVVDLDSRGHSAMTVQEDGSIRVCPKGDGEEVTQGILADFPTKSLWPRLAELLEGDGLAATVRDNCIAVTW